MNASEQIKSILARNNKQNIADHYVEKAQQSMAVEVKANMGKQAMPVAYHHDLEPEIGALLDLLI